ncbi:DUF4390 domain-containing protein [Wohlfahrtiimonas chitiniclastica]|uniref:DUF4390 domain-containing protein n=1 Tax=Wohlfahrtiimonas chitiniclastica TaxID=400946 RepID=UPI00037AA302|nr:DUF4390 domain-containing protein [Wohlfahrtiimonas chitiniclastica]KZS22562.1 hypothetical protein BMY_0383 [Wohlfahrtiimonas chitiniclastica]KZX38062.1 hypothetical protein A6V30_04030 [Wohlfahrtiimonas chitiniclastica]MBS7816125.1 DUF4390 domain-containing protein [Wohlfahrtiimonas chitiniclastica]MBS7817757.1 DUF4390 domain-containing protein [Wohlfahrtiimonas chitiniclastica]MBS7819931.1 DUF4390 domain-containing protein [Wohlfahrtiimonas chitiniclastica]
MAKRIGWLIVLLSSWLSMSFANEFMISSVFVKNGREENSYKIAIDATIEMSKDQIQMLENGIPLTFTYTFVVEEKVGLVWLEGDNPPKNYSFVIAYNALTRQYVVHAEQSKKYENFPTLTLALAYIAEPKNFRIKIAHRKADKIYRGGVRLKLNIDELPTPLRIPAYLSSDWNLDTGWKYWEFAKW